MTAEANMFKASNGNRAHLFPQLLSLFPQEVDLSWKSAMELVEQNPNVMHITEYPGFLDMLEQKNAVLQKISKGLDKYVDKKRIVFPR